MLPFVRDIYDYMKIEFRNSMEEGSHEDTILLKIILYILTNINILIRKFAQMTEYK